MLVLTRKQGEEVVIGDNIRLRVLWIRGNQVRLGVIAPADVSIQRNELLRRAKERASLSLGVPGEAAEA